MPRRTPLTLALSLALLPAAALAQVKTYYHNGAWEAFSGRTDNGTAICGIDSSVGSRHLSIHYDIGATATVFTATKPDWTIPNGTPIPIVIQIGLGTPWTFSGTGHATDIDWNVDHDPMRNFFQQFRIAPSMTITFPSGNEPPWVLPLNGSAAISDTFDRCVQDLTRQMQSQTPPPAAAATPAPATQPFSPPPGH